MSPLASRADIFPYARSASGGHRQPDINEDESRQHWVGVRALRACLRARGGKRASQCGRCPGRASGQGSVFAAIAASVVHRLAIDSQCALSANRHSDNRRHSSALFWYSWDWDIGPHPLWQGTSVSTALFPSDVAAIVARNLCKLQGWLHFRNLVSRRRCFRVPIKRQDTNPTKVSPTR